MHPKMFDYYEVELEHVYEKAKEFGQRFQKMAHYLDIDQLPSRDPYVERLFEGFAYLAARVQLKIDAQFPRFSQYLLEAVYPGYLSPTPSMAIVRFRPEWNNPALAEGPTLRRYPRIDAFVSRDGAHAEEVDSKIGVLKSGKDQRAEYRLAHDVRLWPLDLSHAEYFTVENPPSVSIPSGIERSPAGILLRFRCADGFQLNSLKLDSLPIYLSGSPGVATKLYEQLVANSTAVFARSANASDSDQVGRWQPIDNQTAIRPIGFDDEHALLPGSPRNFSGYRLLREYFALPQRCLFVELAGLRSAVQTCEHDCLEIVILLDRAETRLEGVVNTTQFSLYCAPAVNLIPGKRITLGLDMRRAEHLVIDKVRPMDFDVYQIQKVVGSGRGVTRQFLPFYALSHGETTGRGDAAFYAIRRERSLRQRRGADKRDYFEGTDLYISLVDANAAPYQEDLGHLSIQAVCTNRDIPVFLGGTDFVHEVAVPAERVVQCLAGPTQPTACHIEGDAAWRLISHLSLNYLSLVGRSRNEGAAALRQLLYLYARSDTSRGGEGPDVGKAIRQQVAGLKSVVSNPTVRPLSTSGPPCYGRGLEITLEFEREAIEESGAFLLAAVLDRFFAKYVSMNSFTQTVVRQTRRGEVMRWPIQWGQRQIV